MKIIVPKPIADVCHVLHDVGHQAVVVGGCVRDSILGRQPHDWDVATSALPEQVQCLFNKTVPTGLRHGTITVLAGSDSVEVTTFRSDGEYSDGRHPDSVRLGVTLEEDLNRRDFTMNAMAYSPMTDEITDPHKGQDDIRRRVIRAVGSPEARFREDALRMMRAARFASQLRFSIDETVFDWMDALADTITKVSIERIRDELLKLLAGLDPASGLGALASSGILWKVIPELEATVKCAQNQYHMFDVWRHTLIVIENVPNDPILRLTALLHDVAKPVVKAPHPKHPGSVQFLRHEDVGAEMADVICQRLKLSNDERERVVKLIKLHCDPMQLSGGNASLAAVRRFVRHVGPQDIDSMIAHVRADIIGQGKDRDPDAELADLKSKVEVVLHEKPVLATSHLAIDGRDVMQALAVPPGAVVGKTLAALLEKVTDDPELNTREKLLELLQTMR